MNLALIGKRLDYSFSKIIHEKYLNTNYDLVEIKDDAELDTFFPNFKYDGINVTNPYKEKVIKYLDELDEIAYNTKSVNTIVKSGNKLKGYNTDYYGFDYLIKKNNIDYHNKNIYILGTGGVSKTIAYYFKEEKVIFVSRNKSNKKDIISYEEFKKADIKDNDIIINATPVGMYPNIFDINNSVKIVLTKHKLVTIDLNYNPRISYFSYLSNCYINGIDMLIKQAVVANELITNQKLDNVDTESIANDINGYKNYCVIGMMGSGKTYFGKYYAKKNNLEFVDIDKEIENRLNMSIDKIFKDYGEEYFREVEEETTIEFALKSGYVISCGGGIVLNSKAMYALTSNSCIMLMDSTILEIIDNIKNDKEVVRPLAKDENEIKRIYNERINLYKKYANVIIRKSEENDFFYSETKK